MKSKTVKALRALAKQRGLKGYSKLPKDELLRRLQATGGDVESATDGEAAASPASTETPEPAGTERPEEAAYPNEVWWEPSPGDGPESDRYASAQERVEDAKYALAPTGLPGTGATTDLGEDIDRLPALREPALRLLPQKPGILHAHWVLPEGVGGNDLKLRLARGEREPLEVWEELPLPSRSGTWYFHVPETLHDREVVLQLGFYRGGELMPAIPRGVARIPSLYASATTDQLWWIAEADFRRLYLRAGGFEAGGRRYGWAASLGSPGARPPGPGEERLGWPGGVSSR